METNMINSLVQKINISPDSLYKSDFVSQNTDNNYVNLSFNVPEEISERINAISKGDDFLAYCILFSAAGIFLSKINDTSTVLLGSPGLDYDISLIANPFLPIPLNVNGREKVKNLISNCKAILSEAYSNQDIIFNKYAEETNDLGTVSLKYNICVGMTGVHNYDPDKDKHPLSLNFESLKNKLKGNLRYHPDLFREETIQLIIRQYSNILRNIVYNLDNEVDNVELSDEKETQYLLNFAGKSFKTDTGRFTFELFEEWALKSPDSIALVHGKRKLTYSELNKKANQLAHYLILKGLRKGDRVAIFVERSLEMIISILAVMKAGGVYVPIDSTYPLDRVNQMLRSVKLDMIITKGRLANHLPDSQTGVINYSDELEQIVEQARENIIHVKGANDLCYMIYTSGTTGISKAAGVYYDGWMNLLQWFTNEFDLNNKDKNLIVSSISFDLTQRAIMTTLISGGELHLLSSEEYDPEQVLKTINEQKITCIHCAPSSLYPLVEERSREEEQILHSLRYIFLGGENINSKRLYNWAKNNVAPELINVYGAAECTDVSSYYRLKDYDTYIRSSVPIGKPIYNTNVYVVGDDVGIQPVNSQGEICIGGIGIGAGYLNDENLTRSKFIDDPKLGKLYKTGDKGRILANGEIEFLGRTDSLIKLRGNRVDLGDIESAIKKHQLVQEAVVLELKKENGDQSLLAYIMCYKTHPAVEKTEAMDDLRSFLDANLPAYMIPNHLYLMDDLPLSPNGKIDRKRLLAENPGVKASSIKEPDQNLQILLDIFTEVLQNKVSDINLNFYEHGGHSLLALKVVSLIKNKFHVVLSPLEFLANPTVVKLNSLINRKLLEKVQAESEVKMA